MGEKGMCCGGLQEQTHTGHLSLEALLKCMNRFFMFVMLSEPGNKERGEGRWMRMS